VDCDWLIVGAGLTGAVLAERIATQLGKRVIVIDRRGHFGGNTFDELDDAGVLIHRYGPHIFHTNSDKVVDYLSRFTEWRPYEHRVTGYVDGQMVPVPFNFKSMEMLFGEIEGRRLNKILSDEYGLEVKVPILKLRASKSRDVRLLADFIYEKVFLHYTLKQWGVPPESLDAGVSARVPVHLSYDDRYFQDKFQKMPANGYSAMIERMLAHHLIEFRPVTSLAEAMVSIKFNRMVYTGPIDEYFDTMYGPLPYRSVRFDLRRVASTGYIQGVGTENYPTPVEQHKYTRSTEYRFLTGQHEIEWTTRAFEYPEQYERAINEPFYPVPTEGNRHLFSRYYNELQKLGAVTFAGRLADYKYYNMDQAIAHALMVFDTDVLKQR